MPRIENHPDGSVTIHRDDGSRTYIDPEVAQAVYASLAPRLSPTARSVGEVVNNHLRRHGALFGQE